MRLESQSSMRGRGEKPKAWHRAVRAGSGLWAQPDGCEAVRAPGSTLGSCIPHLPSASGVQGREHCHLHEDPAATSDVPLDPSAMKTTPLSAEPSTWGSLAERKGRKPKGPNQQVREEGSSGARAGL